LAQAKNKEVIAEKKATEEKLKQEHDANMKAFEQIRRQQADNEHALE
jgi:hypothetical protein